MEYSLHGRVLVVDSPIIVESAFYDRHDVVGDGVIGFL